MGKRSTFKRKARDYYKTPFEALEPLLAHLPPGSTYDEPCAGDGALIEHLAQWGRFCKCATDIKPMGEKIIKWDAFNTEDCLGDMFITNPPWPALGKQGDPTIAMALHLSSIAPTWFLLNADVAHNKYFSKISARCEKIVSVGRVSWEQNGIKGKENCAWFLFDAKNDQQTKFYGRI